MRSIRPPRPWFAQAPLVGMSLLVFAIAFVTCSPAEVDRTNASVSGGSPESGGSDASGGVGATGGKTSSGGTSAKGGSTSRGGATKTGGITSKGGSTTKDAGAGSGGSTAVKLDASTRKPYVPKAAPSTGPKHQIIVMPGNRLTELPDGFSVLIEHLTNRGFKVVPALWSDKSLFLDDDKTKVVDLSKYGLVILGNEANANSGTLLATAAIPVISGQRTSVNLDIATSPGADPTRSAITVVNSSHPIAAGFVGTVLLSDTREQRVQVSTGTPANGATIIATGWKGPVMTVVPNPSIFVYDKGEQMVTKPAPARRVHFFTYGAADFPNLNRDGWDLYDAAIDWAMGL